jgi:hypothetical protein
MLPTMHQDPKVYPLALVFDNKGIVGALAVYVKIHKKELILSDPSLLNELMSDTVADISTWISLMTHGHPHSKILVVSDRSMFTGLKELVDLIRSQFGLLLNPPTYYEDIKATFRYGKLPFMSCIDALLEKHYVFTENNCIGIRPSQAFGLAYGSTLIKVIKSDYTT